MEHYNLDTVLLEFLPKGLGNTFTARNAVEGIQIFGGIGSGKTSGSGRKLALKYLSAGFGGLVLTVKPDEKKMWMDYCWETGRHNDLLLLEPRGLYSFNFLEYELSHAAGESAITENIVEVLKTVIRASEEKDKGKTDDAFWESALDLLIFNLIDLCKLAYGKLSIQTMYDIVQSLPTLEEKVTPRMQGDDCDPPVPEKKEKDKKEDDKPEPPKEPTDFENAMVNAKANLQKKIEQWELTLSLEELLIVQQDPIKANAMAEDAVEEVRQFNFLYQFFVTSFKNLSEKTRSIIDFSFSGFLYRLLREPIYSMFCKGEPTIFPEQSLEGKIILLNLPVKLYHKVGRDCQILFKYIWQRAMEKRDVMKYPKPVFLWADEAQNFLHEHDASFQATARSSLVATVYLSQNLPNYYASMGGEKSEPRVKAFLGTLATKIFHANADVETNKYASQLMGQGWMTKVSETRTTAGQSMTASKTETQELQNMVRPEQFVNLKTGGPPNDHLVVGYLHRQGMPFHNGKNFKRIRFNQNKP